MCRGDRALGHPGVRGRPMIGVVGSILGWSRRYLPLEVAGTAAAIAAAQLGLQATGSLAIAAIAGTVGENIGFYSAALLFEARRRREHGPIVRVMPGAVVAVLGEFGPAELVDSFLVRPAGLYLGPLIIGQPTLGWIVGKVAADLIFYVLAALSVSQLGRLYTAPDQPLPGVQHRPARAGRRSVRP